MKKIVGITGGIASGKSNVCNILKELGYVVIDCDQITKELSEKNMPLYNAILKNFGKDYLLIDGELDKKKIAQLVFNNKSSKTLLDNITYPIIKEELLKRIEQYDGLVFIEVPLLYEAKFDNICDLVICVFLNKGLQVRRLMQREGIDEDFALKKIHSQLDLYYKKALADYVIDSKGSFLETKKQVLDILDKINN